MLRGQRHHHKDAVYEPLWYLSVEQVAHAVDEDHAWLLPVQRGVKPLRVQHDLVERAGTLETIGQRFGIAVVTQQPGETLEHPVTGFQVTSVHEIDVLPDIAITPFRSNTS